jgi:hypothetical protein
MNQHIPNLQVSYNLLVLFYLFFCLYIKNSFKLPWNLPRRSDEDEDGGYLSRESQFINKWGGYTEIIWLLAGGTTKKYI